MSAPKRRSTAPSAPLAEDGLGVLVTSSEMEELLQLADRLVVLNEGAVSGQVDADAVDPDSMLALLAAPAPAAA